MTHQFLQQIIEGDELYTRVKKNVAPDASQGWTIVLMDRATRFLWDMQCGRKDRVVYLAAADKDRGLTRRPLQEQKGLDKRTLIASQQPFHPW